jgi:hypothetical protein
MRNVLVIFLFAQLLVACGGPSVYCDEAFVKESPYQREFFLPAQDACEGAQRALLSQAYRIERLDGLNIRAHKDFQPEDEINITIDFDITCKVTPGGALVFVNAIETTYSLKKTGGATSLSVPGAGSISMPWSKSADSLVKTSGTTITDPTFYRRFFDLMTTFLPGYQLPIQAPSGKKKP